MDTNARPMEIDAVRRVLTELRLEARSLAPFALDPSILVLEVAGGDVAVNAWSKLRAALDHTGRWPIVCGDADEFEPRAAEQFEQHARPVAEILAEVPAGNPLDALAEAERAERQAMIEWFKSRGEPLPPYLTMTPQELEAAAAAEAAELAEQFPDDAAADEPDLENFAWPAEPPRHDFSLSSAFDTLERTPLERCQIALLPTMQPADAPAHLRFGGWNACPHPALQVAFLRDWGRRYGAVPAAITTDVIECFVARPPRTPDDARALAQEQYRFCDDIVSQGTQTVELLALELWNAPRWYFWWD